MDFLCFAIKKRRLGLGGAKAKKFGYHAKTFDFSRASNNQSKSTHVCTAASSVF